MYAIEILQFQSRSVNGGSNHVRQNHVIPSDTTRENRCVPVRDQTSNTCLSMDPALLGATAISLGLGSSLTVSESDVSILSRYQNPVPHRRLRPRRIRSCFPFIVPFKRVTIKMWPRSSPSVRLCCDARNNYCRPPIILPTLPIPSHLIHQFESSRSVH